MSNVLGQSLLELLLVGAVIGGGVALLIDGLSVRDRSVQQSSSALDDIQGYLVRAGRKIPFAVAAALVSLVLTRWVVLAAATGVLVLFWDSLFGGARAESRAMARVEGLASWTESLRDTIAGAVGLEQAIPATAYAASPAIRSELTALSDRLRVRMPLPQALLRFADDLDDASADLIVAALILNSRLRGPGLRQVLTSLAHSARSELEMRHRISAGRASTRRSVQIVMIVTVVFVVGLRLFNPSYVQPYSTATGQLVLLFITLLFAAGFFWLRRLAAFEMPARFLSLKSVTVNGRELGAGTRTVRRAELTQ